MSSTAFLAQLLESAMTGKEFTVLIVAIGCLTGIIISVARSVRRVAVARAREQTKREIAAYVAEGTIDPKHAIAMMEAGVSPDADERGSCC